jgi:hypothetical protein
MDSRRQLPVDLILRYSGSNDKLEKKLKKAPGLSSFLWGASGDVESSSSLPRTLAFDRRIASMSFGQDQKFIVTGEFKFVQFFSLYFSMRICICDIYVWIGVVYSFNFISPYLFLLYSYYFVRITGSYFVRIIH